MSTDLTVAHIDSLIEHLEPAQVNGSFPVAALRQLSGALNVLEPYGTRADGQTVRYEHFRDVSYYDMWAVREAGERRWGHCFHLPSEAEAKALCELLNGRSVKP